MRLALLAVFSIVGILTGQVVPRPKHLELGDGKIVGSGVRCDVAAFVPQARAFVRALTGLGVKSAEFVAAEAAVHITKGAVQGLSAYEIRTKNGVLVVTAATTTGVAHATATLLQLLQLDGSTASWPTLRVTDAPDLPFRCFMIDMGRNPHSPRTLRHVVDAMWFYKVNYLHLHLTDDQLFSWPSRAFPKLLSKRAGWTWEQFEALEKYSQARGVTIVPEIDVPGHSTILRRQYPKVFGKTPTDLATQPSAQKGVETLFGEMLSVFKSTPFVHIGGDEAYGVPGDAQRDFINRLNVFIKKAGRRTLVWEGPHLGKGKFKVATDVIHMNWRTINFPAQQMVEAGYDVVNAAWDPLYIVDHYPKTMFTAVDVERCYRFRIQRFAHVNHGMPTFKRPHRARKTDKLLGFCMPWWEGREQNLLGLCVPRLAAVASATWNRQGESDFVDFQKRQSKQLPRLEYVSGFQFPVMPHADPESQKDNLAYRAKVTPSRGASQPVFGPQRLTNGIPDRFDHFLGFPTQPTPLSIVIELKRAAEIGRVVVYERAIGNSHEIYELLVSADGATWTSVGKSGKGTRGKKSYVTHMFMPREVGYLQILTKGCHGLTFPSFSRLSEVMAFAK